MEEWRAERNSSLMQFPPPTPPPSPRLNSRDGGGGGRRKWRKEGEDLENFSFHPHPYKNPFFLIFSLFPPLTDGRAGMKPLLLLLLHPQKYANFFV